MNTLKDAGLAGTIGATEQNQGGIKRKGDIGKAPKMLERQLLYMHSLLPAPNQGIMWG